MRRSFLALLLFPALAVAQTTTTAPLRIRLLSDASRDTYTFGANDCDQTISLQWIYTPGLVGNLCSPLQLWATESSSCAHDFAMGDKRYTPDVVATDVARLGTGSFTVKLSELPGFATTNLADGGTNTPVTCGETGKTKVHLVCGSMTSSVQICGFTTPQNLDAASMTLTYDTQAPSPPTIVDSAAQDSAVRVSFSVDSDSSTVTAEYQASNDAGVDNFTAIAPVSASVGVLKVENLTNGIAYDVRLRATDAAGNVSAPGASVQITPVHTIGFFGTLREAGSTEQGGGCSVAGSFFMLPLAGFALARALARKTRR